ncbi:hypothetical protein GF407_02300 [candidate division KSB1 bacterium]|nr:hypothetical protein [candidate division KSB1 bacterium]
MKTLIIVIGIFILVSCQGVVFGQFIVKNSSGTDLLTVDNSGNATISNKTTTNRLAISGDSPTLGKVPFSIDGNGNLRWSRQPSQSGQYLSWNISAGEWEIANPPVGIPGPPGPPGQGLSGGVAERVAFWTGESSLGHDQLLRWNISAQRLGVGTGLPATRLHVDGTLRFDNLPDGSGNTTVLTMDGSNNVEKRTLSDWSDNQGLSVGAGSATTSIINISGSSSDVTLAAGTGVSLAESGNTITITASGGGGSTYWQRNSTTGDLAPLTVTDQVGIGTSTPATQLHVDGSVRLENLGGDGSGNTLVLTLDASGNVEVRTLSDWSDNQSLSVGAGSGSTSIINISNSSSNVTLAEGSNITLSESGNTITISASGGTNYWQRNVDAVAPATLGDDVGIGITAPDGRLHSMNLGDIIQVKGLTGVLVDHGFGIFSENTNNTTSSNGKFAVMGFTDSPNTTTEGYFNAGVAGRTYNSTGNSILAQGSLGKSQTVTEARWVSGVAGNINAENSTEFIQTGGIGAAVHARVINNTDFANIWAGYFYGAKSYFSHTVTMPGADYAEWFEKEEKTLSGDLIGINLVSGKARKYRPGDEYVGVHSKNPAIAGNSIENEMQEDHVLVALLGQVTVDPQQIRVVNSIVYTLDDKKIGIKLSSGKILLKSDS